VQPAPDTLPLIFHGEFASSFSIGFADLLEHPTEIIILPDELTDEADRRAYAAGTAIVGFTFNPSLPRPEKLTLYQVPGAGYDAVDLNLVPDSAVVCNAFGHEQAIAEYVMAALLMRQVPFPALDRELREGDWASRGGLAHTVHGELAGQTIGLLGFGHIGKAVAARAKAFEMKVVVANRSAVMPSTLVDRAFLFHQLPEFWASADFIVVSLPLTPETRSIVGAEAFRGMRSTAVLINVGRGATVDEAALFESLESGSIGGAVIDTWYRYPTVAEPRVHPSTLPFHTLPNVLMTPHMSAWTAGTIRRRQQTIAENIARRLRGERCVNVVREERAGLGVRG
jgi:phosphoglycerate dehydrogenase-like enzyme